MILFGTLPFTHPSHFSSRSSTPAQEVFAAFFVDSIAGVKTPAGLRVVSYSSLESAEMREALVAAASGPEQAVIKTVLNMPFVLVMDLVNGTTLAQTVEGGQESGAESGAGAAGSLLASLGPGDWADLGKAMVADVVMNNWDRFCVPMLWDHQGNPNNVMFRRSPDGRRVVAIDQAAVAIVDEAQREAYAATASAVLADIGNPAVADADVGILVGLAASIADATGVAMTDDQMGEARAGAVSAMRCLAEPGVDDLVVALKQRVADLVPIDWSSVWADSVSAIDTATIVRLCRACGAGLD